MFKRLTAQQEATYRALRVLGVMIVSPQDARPLKALVKRGLVRYRRIDGARHAVLKATRSQQVRDRRESAWERRYNEWLAQQRSIAS